MEKYVYINLRQKPQMKMQRLNGFIVNGAFRRRLISNA